MTVAPIATQRCRFVSYCERVSLAWLVCLLFTGAVAANPIELTVMTRNVYFGASLQPVIEAPDLNGLLGAVATAFGQVVASNPVERMGRIADEIAQAQPHIVGLQEAVLWRSGTGMASASDTEFDFVGSLIAGLAARGQSYAAVAISSGLDAQAPGLFPTGLVNIRFSDREVILVRTDLPQDQFRVVGSGSAAYSARYPIAILNSVLESINSYAYVDVEMSGRTFRALSTHLDPLVPPVQELQAEELIGVANASPFPQIVLGDFNSPADGSGTNSYLQMLAAGFADSWLQAGSGDGFTSAQAPDLLNVDSLLDERIDFVFHRGGFRALSAEVVGDDPVADRTASGLWPSDHAGVVATLRFVPEPGTLLLLLLGIPAALVVRTRD